VLPSTNGRSFAHELVGVANASQDDDDGVLRKTGFERDREAAEDVACIVGAPEQEV
jgi:hypothetical protein